MLNWNEFFGSLGLGRYRVKVHDDDGVTFCEYFWKIEAAKEHFELVKQRGWLCTLDDLFHRDDYGDCPSLITRDNRTGKEVRITQSLFCKSYWIEEAVGGVI